MADLITEDAARALDQTRKFGLHLTLSHQRLQQLRAAGDTVYSGVMESAKSKIVFQVDDDDSAHLLSRHLFRSQFNLETPKETLTRPVAVGQEIVWLNSQSSTTTTTESTSTVSGWGDSTNESEGVSSFQPFDDSSDSPSGQTEIEGSSSGEFVSFAVGESYGSSQSDTQGHSETFATIYEDRPSAVYTLEELIHFGIVTIRSLPPRNAIAYVHGQSAPVRMRTIDLKKSGALASRLRAWVEKTNRNSAYCQSVIDVADELTARKIALNPDTPPLKPADYFE